MKAISVLQPWATALLGAKDVENRTWTLPEPYLGVPLALHASKRRVGAEFTAFLDVALSGGYNAMEAMLMTGTKFPHAYGAIIGVIVFSDNVTASGSLWFAGPVGWVKQSVIALPRPIPCKGALSLWDVPAEIMADIRHQTGGQYA
jgi:hypothetical protein